VILGIEPGLTLIDLTHNVPAGNLISAGYLAATAWRWLLPRTVLLAVVDPGVGSDRGALVVEQGGKTLVCPDNGLSTLLGDLFSSCRAYRADADYLRSLLAAKPLFSHTFDGRDLFAPLAAEIARGNRSVVSREPVEPVQLADFTISLSAGAGDTESPALTANCAVVHTDHFGNCITALRWEVARRETGGAASFRTAAVRRNGESRSVPLPLRESFSNVGPGEELAYWGSGGFLELGVRAGSYADRYALSSGARVELELRA
ncbi:MAG TPA: SAM-dependent chlorinase/fluorinase, partial [Spirochaetia bacterium]|nr:SAM-dependent chlorinase/fluorinase [Spirochaetia bacterium]